MNILSQYALQFVGIPYVWGGAHPSNGLDCSGLVQIILQAAGLDPKGDQTAQGLYDWCVQSKYPQLIQEGSIVFFGKKPITHVAYCLNADLMIEAGGGGHNTISVQDAIRHEAFVRVRPIASRVDFSAAFLPQYGLRLS